jgi:multidrug resistance efflux pump
LEQMTISAPFDGVVEKVDIHPGETPDPNRHSSIFVVKNDILWVNAYLPTAVTLKLKVGDELDVRYKDTSDVVKGKVIFLSPRADAASEQRRVKLEIANTGLMPSGQTVNVVLPLNLGGAAADGK